VKSALSLGEGAKRLTSVVEDKLPGTKAIYWHPLWRALQFDQPLTRLELFELCATLPAEMTQAIMQKQPSARFWRRPAGEIAWGKIDDGAPMIDRFGAALLLCRDAELSQDPALYARSAAAAEALFGSIKDDVLFKLHWPNLVTLVNSWTGSKLKWFQLATQHRNYVLPLPGNTGQISTINIRAREQ